MGTGVETDRHPSEYVLIALLRRGSEMGFQFSVFSTESQAETDPERANICRRYFVARGNAFTRLRFALLIGCSVR